MLAIDAASAECLRRYMASWRGVSAGQFLVDKAVSGTPGAAQALDRICTLAPEELPACVDRKAGAGAAPAN